MIIAYVAGKYTAATAEERAQNIRDAYDVGAALAAIGFVPLVPHPPESHADAFEAVQGAEWWYQATLELLRRCHVLVTVHNWRESTGAKGEVVDMWKANKPVLLSVADAKAWWDATQPRRPQ